MLSEFQGNILPNVLVISAESRATCFTFAMRFLPKQAVVKADTVALSKYRQAPILYHRFFILTLRFAKKYKISFHKPCQVRLRLHRPLSRLMQVLFLTF